MKNKGLIFGSGLGVILLIIVYFMSQRRLKEGIEYDLSTSGEVFGLEGTGDAAIEIAAPTRAVSIYVEPAKSLIARKMEAFENSPNTMVSIRQRYGIGTNLFTGVPPEYELQIRESIAELFNINPQSSMSFPIWTKRQSPELYDEIERRLGLNFYAIRWGTSRWMGYGSLRIPAWLNWSFGALPILSQYSSSSEGGVDREQWAIYTKFLSNVLKEIKRLDEMVLDEAVQSLRRSGYRFIEYGDTDVYSQAAV